MQIEVPNIVVILNSFQLLGKFIVFLPLALPTNFHSKLELKRFNIIYNIELIHFA